MIKNDQIVLSVIVPVYNVEKYLHQCVDSLLDQTINMEIILVDDGSTDRSGTIAEIYAIQKYWIKVIHQKNMGLSSARNTGIEIATGEYIAFVDSDDWVEKDSLSRLYKEACQYHADVVMANLLFSYPDGSESSPFAPVPDNLKHTKFTGEQCFIELSKSHSYAPMACNYIYRREYIETLHIRFEDVVHEDELWTPIVMCQANRMVISDNDFYHYRQRKGSIMQTLDVKQRLDSIFHITERLFVFIKKYPFSKEKDELTRWLYAVVYRLYITAFSILPENSSYSVSDYHLELFFSIDHLLYNAWRKTHHEKAYNKIPKS